MNYYSLLDKKEWSKAKELLFAKKENLWFMDELENTWDLVDISKKEIVEFDKVTTDLYSTRISMEIFNEEFNYSETVEVHPFVAKIDFEFKIIINKRDIPSQFGIECAPDEIIMLESAQ